MKILVAYISWTGNTKKIAETIFSEIQGDKQIKSIEEVKDCKGYDIIFLGFPVHGFGQMPQEAKSFLENYCAGKKIALFVTHAAPEDSSLVKEWLKKFTAEVSEDRLLGIFDCQGQISKEESLLMQQSPDSHAREIGEKVALSSKGKPDKVSFSRARIFASQIMQKL